MTVRLSDLINWTPGTQILLPNGPEHLIDLRCGDRTMFLARMGQKNGKIAVKIEHDVDDDKDDE